MRPGNAQNITKTRKKRPILCKIFGRPGSGSDRHNCLGAQRRLKIEGFLLYFGAILLKSGQILHQSKGWFWRFSGLLTRILYPLGGGSLMNSSGSETEGFCRQQPHKGQLSELTLLCSSSSNHLGKCPMELAFPVRAVCPTYYYYYFQYRR